MTPEGFLLQWRWPWIVASVALIKVSLPTVSVCLCLASSVKPSPSETAGAHPATSLDSTNAGFGRVASPRSQPRTPSGRQQARLGERPPARPAAALRQLEDDRAVDGADRIGRDGLGRRQALGCPRREVEGRAVARAD